MRIFVAYLIFGLQLAKLDLSLRKLRALAVTTRIQRDRVAAACVVNVGRKSVINFLVLMLST